MKKEYIDGKKENGLKYDWKLIFKKYKSLNVPKEFNILSYINLKARWQVLMSDRSNGKTTNTLLIGMIMNYLYGTQIQYIRQRETMIAPKNSRDIFTTILQFDYVSKITDGEFNSIEYKAKRWYFCNRDDDGNVLNQCENHFMMMLSIDRQEDYKSSYNAPFGDFIVFDEFIGRFTPVNEFVEFNQLLKTIIRERMSAIIFLLANNINTEHCYFDELEIMDTCRLLTRGDKQLIESKRGTLVNVVLFESRVQQKKERSIINKLYFGWGNPLMSSITGEADWAIDDYQHEPINLSGVRVLMSNCYIMHNNILIRLEVRTSNELPVYIHCYKAQELHDDSIVFTLKNIEDSRYIYGVGYSKLHKWIYSMYRKNLFYYRTNIVGTLVTDYYTNAKKRTY